MTPAIPDAGFLDEIARTGEAPLDLGRYALALAGLDRPGMPVERYMDILGEMVSAVKPSEGPTGLSETLAGGFSFRGDDPTYDDLQNANLMRVIDRRQGLPVALGIVYIHCARALGWDAKGLNFPNHFLVRVDTGRDRSILDPFDGGRELDVRDLRKLLTEMGAPDGPVPPEVHQDVPDRNILLRLQNNILVRQISNRNFEQALNVVRRMQRMAPDETSLLRESGLLLLELGRLDDALSDLEDYQAFHDGSSDDHMDVAAVIQQLQRRLH